MNNTKIAFSGRFFAGKDYCADQAGLKVVGFADPMYLIAEHYFGTSDKTKPGIRQFLQEIGQIGRGHIDEKYPASLARMQLVEQVRKALPEILESDERFDTGTDWATFGSSATFWVDLLLSRPDLEDEQGVAVVNARFPFELDALKQAGFSHVHVMASQEERERRGAPKADSPLNQDVSERMATGFDGMEIGRAHV